MNSVRKILVPIDFSEDSANGLKYALSLAQETRKVLKEIPRFPCPVLLKPPVPSLA